MAGACMRWQTFAARVIAEGAALVRAPCAPRPGLRILMYHAVGSPVRGDRLGIFTLSVERFRAQVDMLAEMLTIPFAPPMGATNALHIAITFDDGYADNLHVAAPLLVERGLPFTVFVTTDFVREGVQGFLTPAEVRALSRVPGASIGAHGCTHRPLTECKPSELLAELGDSKNYLEDLLGQPVTSLAYPHGAADGRVRDAAAQVGYQIGACSHFDINHPGRDPLMLNRCNILRDDTARVLRQKLRGDWDWYRWRSNDPLSDHARVAR